LTPGRGRANYRRRFGVRAREGAADRGFLRVARMVPFDLEFLSRSLGMVGLFFICCAILHQKPKHLLEESFGVHRDGLRNLRGSVFRKNQLVLGFLCALAGLILNQFGHIIGRSDGHGLLNDAAAPTLILSWLLLVFVLCAVLNYLCRLFSKRHFKRVVREVAAEHKWPFEKNMTLTTEIGDLLGVTRQSDDTVERYVARLRCALALPLEDARSKTPIRATKLEVSFK
jgi:hypothetical protein